MIYFIVFILQILFNIGKVFEIKLTYENKTNALLLNSIFMNLVSLGSVYYSIDNLLKGDFWVIFFYVSGSVFGKWVGMTKVKNYRAKLLSFFDNGNKDN